MEIALRSLVMVFAVMLCAGANAKEPSTVGEHKAQIRKGMLSFENLLMDGTITAEEVIDTMCSGYFTVGVMGGLKADKWNRFEAARDLAQEYGCPMERWQKDW